MKRLLLPLLIALPLSGVVTVILLFAAGFAGGACHCMTPVSLLFPYGTFIVMRTRFEAIGIYSDVLQFPIYATLIAVVNGWQRRLIASIVVLIVHSLAAIGALTMYRWL